MATLLEIHTLVGDTVQLRQRFCAGRMKSAWYVVNEPANTPNHDLRVAWAYNILQNYEYNLDYEYRYFLSNGTVQDAGNEATDNDITFVIDTFLDRWAGA